MTTDQLSTYQIARARADRIRELRGARMRAACCAAGIGDYHGCVLHNALIAAERGQPWRGVDTSQLRLARRLERSMWDGYRILDRWSTRVR